MRLTTPTQIAAYRHTVLIHALKLELLGMRRRRGPSAFAILKRQTGYPARTKHELYQYLLQQQTPHA